MGILPKTELVVLPFVYIFLKKKLTTVGNYQRKEIKIELKKTMLSNVESLQILISVSNHLTSMTLKLREIMCKFSQTWLNRNWQVSVASRRGVDIRQYI